MRFPKVSHITAAAVLAGIFLLAGCALNQRSDSSQNNPGSNPQTEATSTQATDDSDDAPSGDDRPVADSEEETSAPDPDEAEPVLILVEDKVTTLDPYKMVTIHPDDSVASHLWDTLTRLNNALQVKPSLAKSWRLVNNFTWEFELRPGLAFHNGEPLDAEAVRFSIERAESLPGSLETFARDVALENVEIVDDHTLRLTTGQPVVNLPYHLTFLEILPPQYYTETSPDQLAQAPVGSGPYRLAALEDDGDTLILEAVSAYWKGPPALPRLVIKTVPLVEERLAALRLGEAALVTDLPPTSAEAWDLPKGTLETIESTQRIFVGLAIEESSPLADERVRQALNYAVDVDQLIRDWHGGYGTPYGSPLNPPAANPELTPWPYDPELARQFLAEAGYSEGFTTTLRTPVDIYYNDASIAESIAQQLKEVGITVTVNPVRNWGVYVRQLLAGDSDSLFLLGLNSRGDSLEDLSNLAADVPINPGGWRNASFETALEQARTDFNETARMRHLANAEEIVYREVPWIGLWRPFHFYGVSHKLDWMPRKDGLVNLYQPLESSPENSE